MKNHSSSGNLTAASVGHATPTGFLAHPLLNATVAAMSITGTFTGTITFEASADGGTTWVAINGTPLGSTTPATSATAAGIWQFNVGGLGWLQARCTAYTSGGATVVIQSNTSPG